MTILSLNLWGGRRFDALMSFICEKAKEVDVFCFQEMVDGGRASSLTEFELRGNLYEEMTNALPDFQGFKFVFRVPPAFHIGCAEEKLELGLAVFVKKEYAVVAHEGVRLYEEGLTETVPVAYATGNFLWLTLEKNGRSVTVGSVHGLFLEFRSDNPSKGDTLERIEQSRRIINMIERQKNSCVIMGDFNLRPETESVAMLSRVMKNLIAEYGIKTTRNFEYREMEQYQDYIADYVFVSPELPVKDFKVLPDVVSDHAPLMLELE